MNRNLAKWEDSTAMPCSLLTGRPWPRERTSSLLPANPIDPLRVALSSEQSPVTLKETKPNENHQSELINGARHCQTLYIQASGASWAVFLPVDSLIRIVS